MNHSLKQLQQKKIEVGTEGENANAEYNDNDVSGNQYNGNAVHNEKK